MTMIRGEDAAHPLPDHGKGANHGACERGQCRRTSGGTARFCHFRGLLGVGRLVLRQRPADAPPSAFSSHRAFPFRLPSPPIRRPVPHAGNRGSARHGVAPGSRRIEAKRLDCRSRSRAHLPLGRPGRAGRFLGAARRHLSASDPRRAGSHRRRRERRPRTRGIRRRRRDRHASARGARAAAHVGSCRRHPETGSRSRTARTRERCVRDHRRKLSRCRRDRNDPRSYRRKPAGDDLRREGRRDAPRPADRPPGARHLARAAKPDVEPRHHPPSDDGRAARLADERLPHAGPARHDRRRPRRSGVRLLLPSDQGAPGRQVVPRDAQPRRHGSVERTLWPLGLGPRPPAPSTGRSRCSNSSACRRGRRRCPSSRSTP